MFKKIIAFFLVSVSVIAVFTACNNETKTQNESTAPETQSRTEVNVLAKETETTSRKETTTQTESESEATLFPTELSSTPLLNSYFSTPLYQYFYNNSLKEKDTYLVAEVAEILNNSLKSGKWGILKLAVTDDMVAEITEKETCLELVFDKNYIFTKKAEIGGRNFEYDKVLIVLTGEYKDCIFFSLSSEYLDGVCREEYPTTYVNEYLDGPIKDMNGKIADTLLAHIYD